MRERILVPAALPDLDAALLRRLLAAPHGVDAAGDHGFADDGETAAFPANGRALKPAAVLVLFIDRPGGPTMLFTQRTAHLTDHAGQISFPGGRVEDGDAHVTETALRETREETGIDVSAIEVLGELPYYTTGTGYRITPVVAWSPAVSAYQPDPTEVSECFEVPVQFLTDVRNHRIEQAMYKGRLRSYYAIPYLQRYIWGATAGMLVSLTRVLYAGLGIDAGPPVRAAADSGG
ncbi:MAG: CoA pyrophosphatase [Betaproteobacteria bacterium]|nr:CoA pyrophosphatase [Betaproteobacteria bacterium]